MTSWKLCRILSGTTFVISPLKPGILEWMLRSRQSFVEGSSASKRGNGCLTQALDGTLSRALMSARSAKQPLPRSPAAEPSTKFRLKTFMNAIWQKLASCHVSRSIFSIFLKTSISDCHVINRRQVSGARQHPIGNYRPGPCCTPSSWQNLWKFLNR